ncbi:metal ABC transporter solute-binding protein, Zn/Mn family [Protaetiibacter mangrovi]|uniref:Zinc ABC transporter substrate-binding protein n=1 Tax=Protaetiibacter mangrovi TaxID=2970926 RepID=A0ABT1ZDS6_9MICO|nr:zinc ABC transporter substrate-binding protein [Protaetiibacter mangrovi]MCS0498857.1 zinc ABC transporter substrate-binding protein [Protaetiibacter mangrovi]TPX05111.1 ABC transporter substrate-binding protein [Schumannella luteola]
MPRLRPLAPVALLTAAALALGGCTADDATVGADGIRIVASTNVYGDIAATIAGDGASVTSIIHDAAQDPHEYEADGRDALAISRADIVIVNGGGYDDFMTALLDAHASDAVTVIDVAQLSGLDPEAELHDHGDEGDEHDDEGVAHDHGAFNEHVWYHFGTMATVGYELAESLAGRDPARASAFADRATTFSNGIDALQARAGELAARSGGAQVAITEPVPLYLLEAAGLVNATPEAFSEAVEEGTDAPALVVQQMVALVSDGSVALLAYNEQTVGPQTEVVLTAAQEAGTPVVSFSELLPAGAHYLDWMAANLDAVDEALA